MRYTTIIAVVSLGALLIGACSGQNREGPIVTCSDLGNGATNACEQGIIATCTGAKVTYRVCDDDKACGQTWQTAGQYRCTQTESGPSGSSSNTAGTSGANGAANGGTSGSGGSAGTTVAGGSGGPAGTGASGVGGQVTDGGTAGCGVNEVCVIASSVSASDIGAIALDTDNIYFADGCHVNKVPKLGGFSTELLASSGCTGLTTVGLAVDATHVYWAVVSLVNSRDSKVVRVPIGGGQAETIGTDFVQGLTIDENAVYWGAQITAGGTNTSMIKRYDKTSAAVTMFAKGSYAPLGSAQYGGLWSTATNLYWVTSNYMGIAQLLKTAAETDAPATVPVTDAHELAVGGSDVFFIGNSIIGKVDASGNVQSLFSAFSQGTHIAVNASTIYWANDQGIHSLPKAGGTPGLVEDKKATSIYGAMAADDSFVFIADRKDVKRAPK